MTKPKRNVKSKPMSFYTKERIQIEKNKRPLSEIHFKQKRVKGNKLLEISAVLGKQTKILGYKDVTKLQPTQIVHEKRRILVDKEWSSGGIISKIVNLYTTPKEVPVKVYSKSDKMLFAKGNVKQKVIITGQALVDGKLVKFNGKPINFTTNSSFEKKVGTKYVKFRNVEEMKFNAIENMKKMVFEHYAKKGKLLTYENNISIEFKEEDVRYQVIR